jgi:hypothetical protein
MKQDFKRPILRVWSSSLLHRLTLHASLLLVVLIPDHISADQPPLQSAKNWEIRGAADRITWVELHELDSKNPAVIHVEVLSRKKTDKEWHIDHLVPHLAITLEALERSVVRPLSERRGVYPEMFDAGYRRWQEDAGVVCDTTIYESVDTRH